MTQRSLGFLLCLAACSSSPPASEGSLAKSSEPLAATGFTSWSQLPAVGGGVFFKGRPNISSSYTDAANRGWGVCATAFNNTAYCTNRFISGGIDSGWSAWSPLTPPAGITLGASQPSGASWNDINGIGFSALAVRQSGGSCPNCVVLRVQQPGVSVNWFTVPNSGLSNSFTGELSLVANEQYLYLFAVTGSGPYSAHYTRNNVRTSYSNSNWEAWQQLPGGGLFNYPVVATSARFGGVLVVGTGLDNQAYVQKFQFNSWDGFWQVVGAGGVFKDSLSVTNFSGIADDIELFGLGNDNAIWQGDLNAAHTVFNGWAPVSNTTFLHAPNANAPTSNHVDLAALGNTQNIYVASYDRAASCADGSAEQVFFSGAVGCAGAVNWSSRASLCGTGSRVCSSSEWVEARRTTIPTHDYWTNDNLLFSGSSSACSVSTTSGSPCPTNQPMRVCTAAGADAEGNFCTWHNCGYGASSPNQYFGGCNGNPTAGTLCCPG